MELYGNAPPAAVGVPTKLLPRDPEATAAGAYPYCAAAQELGLLVLESCPQKKLECIGEGGRFGWSKGRRGSDQTESRPRGRLESAPSSLSGRPFSCPVGVCPVGHEW